MALAKVTIEALTQMVNTLRQSADDILATKEQMDNELRSFPWDDPIGLAFIGRYEEDFKPLKEKLIPNIEDYIQYMNKEGMIVSEYSGEDAGGFGIGGAVGAGAAGIGIASAVGMSATTKFSGGEARSGVRSAPLSGLSDEKMSELANKGVISYDDDPANVDLSEEDYKKLSADPSYQRRYDAYLAELRKRKPDFAKGISNTDIDEINSAVFDLKEDELNVSFERLGKPKTLGGQAEGELAKINDDFLDSHPDRSVCGIGAIGAHESTHAKQWKIYQEIQEKSQSDPKSLTKNEKIILKTFNKSYSGWSQAYHDDFAEVDSRISQYAFRDACNQYVVETYYSEEKP